MESVESLSLSTVGPLTIYAPSQPFKWPIMVVRKEIRAAIFCPHLSARYLATLIEEVAPLGRWVDASKSQFAGTGVTLWVGIIKWNHKLCVASIMVYWLWMAGTWQGTQARGHSWAIVNKIFSPSFHSDDGYKIALCVVIYSFFFFLHFFIY